MLFRSLHWASSRGPCMNSPMGMHVWKELHRKKCKLVSILSSRIESGQLTTLSVEVYQIVVCQLCKKELESASHYFFCCRYSLRIWGMVNDYHSSQTFMLLSRMRPPWSRIGSPLSFVESVLQGYTSHYYACFVDILE